MTKKKKTEGQERVTEAINGAALMGMTEADVEELEKELEESGLVRFRGRDRRICVCGHRVSGHSNAYGHVVCSTTRVSCPCTQVIPVLEAEDVRLFSFKTVGGGPLHALGRGILASDKKGKLVKWVDKKCFSCKEESETLIPVPVSERMVPVDKPSKLNGLFCKRCRLTLEENRSTGG
jgi:hypothetical protein